MKKFYFYLVITYFTRIVSFNGLKVTKNVCAAEYKYDYYLYIIIYIIIYQYIIFYIFANFKFFRKKNTNYQYSCNYFDLNHKF